MAQAFAGKEDNHSTSADQFEARETELVTTYEAAIPENTQAPPMFETPIYPEESPCPPRDQCLPLSRCIPNAAPVFLHTFGFILPHFISPKPPSEPRKKIENCVLPSYGRRPREKELNYDLQVNMHENNCKCQAFADLGIDDSSLMCPFQMSKHANVFSCTIPPKDPGLQFPTESFQCILDNDEDQHLDETASSRFVISFRAFHFAPRTVLPIYTVSRDQCPVSCKIKYYAMCWWRSKLKRKKIHTSKEKENSGKSSIGGNFTEIIHETYSIFEGPAEVPLMQPPKHPNNRGRLYREPRQVVPDGVISDIPSDPPGQQTKYIRPGDSRQEAYRLSTFEHFSNKAVATAALAKHGFVYTGYSDRVKCFSCGRSVESWTTSDNPADRKWHKNDCSFANGHPSGNVPLGGLFGGSISNLVNSTAQQPMDQSTSYSSQNTNAPFTRAPNDSSDLQRGGTYQLQPGQGLVIGPGSQPQPFHATPTTRPPGNNPPPARNPPRQWRMANVISADHKRHLTNLYLNRELDRLASFGRWPTGRPNVAPVSLARAGFFYLGDMDRTQCFSCGGVLRNWSAADIALDEHRTHFPNCRFVVGVERRNVPIPNMPETQQQLAANYPCRFPMNPHMRSEASRVQTFDRRWPGNRTRATPQEISEAGFFFLGERDRVKCWYCNGGLQNWEYDDIPWVEHAKWFPNCQFLLATKGQLFVHEHLSHCPHLPRPIISRQDGAAVDTSTATSHSSAPPPAEPPLSPGGDVPPPASRGRPPSPPPVSRVRAPTPPPAIIDPQEDRRKRMERVDKEMNEGEAVKVVKAMGYDEDLIRRAILEKLESGTPHDAEDIFDGTTALLEAVMQKEEEDRKEQEEEQATSIKFPSVSSNYSSFNMESMDTSASMGHTSGVHNVSGFHIDSDDEDRDLYGGGASNQKPPDQPIGYVGGATSVPMSLESETTLKSTLWQDIPSDPESMKEFIEQKKEEGLCKICFTEPADMVFLPCSHMACCLTCTQALRTCPVCRTRIEKAIKTYTK